MDQQNKGPGDVTPETNPFREIEPHEFDDVLTLKEAARKITNNRAKKRGKTTLLLALRKREILGYIDVPNSRGRRIGIPRNHWKSVGRETLEDASGPYKIAVRELLPLIAETVVEAQHALKSGLALSIDDALFPELAVWLRSKPGGWHARGNLQDVSDELNQLLTTLAGAVNERAAVFVRLLDVRLYVGGVDGKKRIPPGTKPVYMEERFWVTLFGFFSDIKSDLNQEEIIRQMNLWCEKNIGHNIDGTPIISPDQIEDKVRLAYQQLGIAKRNRRLHPAIESDG